MIIQRLAVGMLQTNCYLIGCEETRQGAVIDPGGDADRILQVIDRQELTVRYVLNTHGHFDHVAANADLIAATGATLAIHPADAPLLQENGGATWFGIEVPKSPPPGLELEPGTTLRLGELQIQVLATPGHTPGSVTFYEPDAGVAFDGDAIFSGGIGRTDLPGGDRETLMRSIRETLLALPDETVLYPGHGPRTTVAEEKGALQDTASS